MGPLLEVFCQKLINLPGSGTAAGEEGMVPPDEVRAALFRVMRRHPEARDELVGEFEALQARFDASVIDGEAVGHDAAE